MLGNDQGGQPRVLLAIVAAAAMLAAGERSLAEGSIDEDCRRFREQCADARAQGASEAGICNVVERLGCTTEPANDPAAGARNRRGSSVGGADGRSDQRRSVER